MLLDLQQLFDIDAKSIAKFKHRLTRGTPYQAVPLKFKLTEDEISRFAVNRYRLAGIETAAAIGASLSAGRRLYARIRLCRTN